MQNKKHTLLLIDDKPENLMALKSILDLPEREIICCLSGSEALQVLLKKKVSLILVDVQMPDMDGYEFVEIIKSHPDTVFIPTIFVTAISNEHKYLTKAYDLGAIDFLSKPLNTEITRKKVESFLKIWDYDQELKKLNETLAQKNEELEQFAHIIAHDLKTPLGSIQTLINVIEEDYILKLDGDVAELFEMVKTSSKNMSVLIDDLLYYSKNVQDNEGKEVVNVESALDEVLKLINPSVNVEISKENLNHAIVFQPFAFNQIVSNLLSNAIKYNDKEVSNIKISFNPENFSLSVKDNGPGIENKYHTKIFEMFQTLGKSFNGESSTGIGLNLVKKLVERNDATIDVKNNDDIGCEFIISNLEVTNDIV
ncbi:hybrid sensor histidine kinase/response regulator [Flavobacterium degerlachei]|jgi:signal transduction histidine kinase|uniref:histidine kinase n=1 Tax=Flavobacterium degerlachei TaxID=229203 RepID=A0A1H2UAF3_9FLAO|nr:hybrid sensor histidine kinase/response regulator [Flavobacterium degerlachei]SDW52434.1 His Kinase A (phospho-acceptor) domain-containing protein [Flavobacterium degerlachei]